MSDMVAFFKSQFNKEKKRLMKDILYAFVKKHNIFDCTPNDDDEASNKEIVPALCMLYFFIRCSVTSVLLCPSTAIMALYSL